MLQSFSSCSEKISSNRKVKFTRKIDSSCQAVLCVTSTETLALVLSHEVVVEITLHRHIRICRIGCVAATICRGGRVAAVHHPCVEIVQQETQVLFDMAQGPRVRATSNALHVLGVQREDPLARVHSVTKQKMMAQEDVAVAADGFCLRRDIDATAALFLDDVAGGDMLGIRNNKRERCLQAARQSIVEMNGNQLNAIVQGVKVKHDMNSGDTRIYCGRNFIALTTHALTLHSPWVDINIDRTSRTRLCRGEQIIETSGIRLQISQNSIHVDFAMSPPETSDYSLSSLDSKMGDDDDTGADADCSINVDVKDNVDTDANSNADTDDDVKCNDDASDDDNSDNSNNDGDDYGSGDANGSGSDNDNSAANNNDGTNGSGDVISNGVGNDNGNCINGFGDGNSGGNSNGYGKGSDNR